MTAQPTAPTPTDTPPAAALAVPTWHYSAPDGCRKCHKTDAPHYARGLCRGCYFFEYHRGTLEAWGKSVRVPTQSPPVRHTCEGCGDTFLARVSAGQRFCSHQCWADSMHDRRATIPTGYVSPRDVGILPGQPPVSPKLDAPTVWRIGNVNARRATRWLTEHGESFESAIALATWHPASCSEEAKAA